ncbi:ribonuclease P protein component [uncultured Alistipes sp.]|uniref:ribonuclease P protein component n=1 Tax=uncultured Alistipes sp. TaxID=538949 RepID=UPI00261A4930|nr:ribonuclease P protein component [uncultured Alistipes sp.]
MTVSRTFPRAERLRTLGAIRRLFASGESGFVYPFRYLFFAEGDDRMSVEVLVSVPKKFHKRANRRNRVRRCTKEAYRLNKERLAACGKSAAVDVAFIYSSKEVLSYKTIEHAVRKILAQIAERM